MVLVVHVKGIRFDAKTEVTPPKRRFGLPCYDKDSCEVRFCRESDTFVEGRRTEAQEMLGIRPKKQLIRQCARTGRSQEGNKNMNCKRRISFSRVPIRVCKNCQHINVQEGLRIYHVPPNAECTKAILEAQRSAHTSTPYSRDRRLYRRSAVGGWHYRDI